MIAFIKARLSLVATIAVLGVFAFYLMGAAFRPDGANRDGYDFETLRRVPIVEGGRTKPLDTYARTVLRLHNASEEFEDPAGKTRPAIVWFMEILAADLKASTKSERTGIIWESEAFKIDNDQLLGLLGLKAKSGLRYALKDFGDKLDVLDQQVERARTKSKDERDLFDNKVLEFSDRIGEFFKVKALDLRVLPPTESGGEWGVLRVRLKENNLKSRDFVLNAILKKNNLTPAQWDAMPAEKRKDVLMASDREMAQAMDKMRNADPELNDWTDLIESYREHDKARFNQLVAKLAENSKFLSKKEQLATRLEVFYNHFAPFYDCTGMYVTTCALALVGLMLFGLNKNYASPALWAAYGLLGMTFLLHTFGLLSRMYIQGRPPVTNLYSSAIFIGWGCVLLGLILERIYPIGIATLTGGFLGFVTTLIAHGLGSDRDTMEMMQAVLDTNLWLATHVTMVTFGYVATFVAGFLGIDFILLGVFTPILDRKTFKALGGIIYGVVCFALFLSFVGTVLGGIWADYSWGRFWGWDPKENGAFLIVIWNAVVLHARWGGMVKQRGFAVLTIVGCFVTTWSWFGTNMLGVGLHSYGFSATRLTAIVVAFVAWGLIIALGLAVPAKHWRSFGEQFTRRPPPPPTPESKTRSRRAEPVVAS